MTREVFGTGHDSCVLHAFHISNSKCGNLILVFAEGTETDHGVIGIVIDIHHRRIVHMHPDPFALFTHGYSHPVHQVFIINGPDGQLIRKFRHAVEPHAQSPFAINGDHQWGLCDALVKIGQISLANGTTLEKAKGTHIVFLYFLGYFGHMVRTEIGVRPDHHQLGDALVIGQGVEHTVHPLGLVELTLVLCLAKAGKKKKTEQ